MARLLVPVILLAAFAFIGYQLFSFFFAINNNSSQKRRDTQRLKQKLADVRAQLVKIDDSELAMLSTNVENVSRSPGLNPEFMGVFTSVYHEPFISFAEKKYGPSFSEKITIAQTSSNEFVYQTADRNTTVIVDGQEIGVIHSDGNLYDMKGRQVAHIEVDDILSTHLVRIGRREVGEIVNPLRTSSPNPRAYTFLEPMDHDERVLFMSLTLLSLIEETVT